MCYNKRIMKKKLIIFVVAILVLSVMAFALVACNRATTQGQLSNFLVDHAEEVFVYDVKNEHIRSVTVYFDIETVPEGSRLVSSSDLDLPFFMSQMLKPVLLNFLNVLVDCVKTTTERDMENNGSTLAMNP